MFAKLFDTPNGQLLYFKTSDDDDEPIITVMGEPIGGVVPSAHCGYEGDEIKRDLSFSTIDQTQANRTASSLAAAVRKLFPKSSGGE